MSKLPVSVIVTCKSERETAIRTCEYFAEFCREVILVDEQDPALNCEGKMISAGHIKYIHYGSSTNSENSELVRIYDKRLVGCRVAGNPFVIHSNHDEIYTKKGLSEAVGYLKKNSDHAYCTGQCMAFEKSGDPSEITFRRIYKRLAGYQNSMGLEKRFSHLAVNYVPVAHYALWQKAFLEDALGQCIKAHASVSEPNFLDELIFEFVSVKQGKSRAVPTVFWLRNLCNHKQYRGGRVRPNNAYDVWLEKMRFALPELSEYKRKDLLEKIRPRHPLGREASPMTWPRVIKKLKDQFLLMRKKGNQTDSEVFSSICAAFDHVQVFYYGAEAHKECGAFQKNEIERISKYIDYYRL